MKSSRCSIIHLTWKAFLSVVLITEMLEICIHTSYDQNVQLILKSYLPVVYGTPLNSEETNPKVIDNPQTNSNSTVIKEVIDTNNTQSKECNQPCNTEQDQYMMQCHKCHRWTHYLCTKLPVYQLYTLTHSNRRYTCEKCSEVPNSFKEKWALQSLQSQTKNNSDMEQTEEKITTLRIVQRTEDSVVKAITEIHQNSQGKHK